MNDDNWIHLMDEWFKNHFLDPLTSVLDETEFRIDVYETEKEYIVEALLPNCNVCDIHISVEKNLLIIKAILQDSISREKKRRTIDFPIPLTQNPIHAVYTNQILEIFIKKEKQQNYLQSPSIPIEYL
ncbi:Hsp20/alpha crystallin family protein [Niallia sp. JL1B1071]|uniref:Hsp20/alpha crystallin family protein n=1 Tax=Niallia tiangongensis TaxID=3237105 RepID=UPI0037DDC429